MVVNVQLVLHPRFIEPGTIFVDKEVTQIWQECLNTDSDAMTRREHDHVAMTPRLT